MRCRLIARLIPSYESRSLGLMLLELVVTSVMTALLFSQIFDTSFPTGTYAHSYGLEGFVTSPYHDGSSFPEQVNRYVSRYLASTLIRGELPFFFDLARTASNYFSTNSTLIESKRRWIEQVRLYGSKCFASLPTRELRTAFTDTGHRTLQLLLDIESNDLLLAYSNEVKRNNIPPWTWAAISSLPQTHDGCTDEVAALGCFAAVKTMVINAQRIGPLGHRNTQAMLSNFARQIPIMVDLAKTIPVDDAINVSLVVENSQYRHVTLDTKLFKT